MRSAWRGDALKTSIPNRHRSLCGAPVAIISIAQHARPKVAGNIERDWAHRAALSMVVMRRLEGAARLAIRPLAPRRQPDSGPGGAHTSRVHLASKRR